MIRLVKFGMFLFFVLLSMFSVRSQVLGQNCLQECYSPDGWCDYWFCGMYGCPVDPDCLYYGNYCKPNNCPSLSTQTYCAGPSGGTPNLGTNCMTVGPWGYCYNPKCVVTQTGMFGKCDYSWDFTSCGAYDTCESGPYLKAGNCGTGGYACDSTGCLVGGTYKTCCQTVNGNFTGQLGGNCTGGCRSGLCPSGSSPVICGVSSCSGISAPCTTQPCGMSACSAMGTPLPTNTPVPGTTNTPVPTSTCSDCSSNESNWCAPSAQACSDAGGRLLSNPCPYCTDPNTVRCCRPQDSSCPLEMNVKGTYSVCEPQVEIEAIHRPRTVDGNVDCGCAYSSLSVKIISSPPGSNIPSGYHVCTIYDSCNKWSSCFWDTTNMQNAPDSRNTQMPIGPYPPGNYVLDIFYGGHTPDLANGNRCSDPMCSANDSTSLGPCPTPNFPPPCSVSTCPVGTSVREVSLTSPVNFNPAFENGYTNWLGSTGTIGQASDCCPWESQGCGGSCCPNGTSSGYCSTKWNDSTPLYNINNTITGLKPNTDYLVQVSGWGARGSVDGREVLQKPYLKMTSGSMSSAWYKITDNYKTSWGEAKPNGPWETETCRWNTYGNTSIKVDLKGEGSPFYGYWGTPWGVSFDNLKLYECGLPKTCTVTSSSWVKNKDDSYSVTVSGSNLGAGESVRLWLERRDGRQVTGLLSSDYISAYNNGSTYNYQIGGCSSASGTCSQTVNLSSRWAGDDYYFHCDVPNSGTGGGCSGNPACTYENGFCQTCPGSFCNVYPCDGWNSCSSTDNRCFCINSPPIWNASVAVQPPNNSELAQITTSLRWAGGLQTWGHACSGGRNYAVYITEVGLDDNCPTAANLFIPGNLKVTNRFGSNNCSSLPSTTTSCNLSALNWDRKYCWGVRAVNGSLYANTGPYSFRLTSAEPWFQVTDGGILSGGSMVNMAPPTCVDPCKPVLSVGTLATGADSNGIVSASGLSSLASTTYGSRNDYHVERNITLDTYTYDWFYNEYYRKQNIGTVWNGDTNISQILGNGVHFVNGNLNITGNKQVASGSYLVVIVSGNVQVASTVNRVDGIYVANDINVGGVANDPLVIGGSIYIRNGINFSDREFQIKSMNNTVPSVRVVYRPDFLFNMPQELIKILSRYYDD